MTSQVRHIQLRDSISTDAQPRIAAAVSAAKP
jgi:hypothetical protein